MAAAAYHLEEEQLWKCPNHPTKRRRNGICAVCLRDRLVSLCPTCGNARPCPCVSATISSSSSSSSSSDHSFRRSRSLAIPFLRSNTVRVNMPSFLSVFSRNRTKNGGENNDNSNFNVDDDSNTTEKVESNKKIEDFERMITRSRSVSVGTAMISSSAKGKFWHFPKAFRSSKTPKVMAQDRSPLHRG